MASSAWSSTGRCVITRVRAWDFVMGFARDNDLVVAEACLLSEAPSTESSARRSR